MTEVESHEPDVVVPLPWEARISSMPYLPGGSTRQLEVLYVLFVAIEEHDGLGGALIDLGDGVERTLRDAVKQVAPAGLVARKGGHFSISDEAHRWFTSGEVSDLLAVFHRHVRYVGELLQALEVEPRTVRELVDVAAAEYQLQWSTSDQVRRRLTWFTNMGLTEYKTTTHVGLTDAGHAVLEGLQLDGPPSLGEEDSGAVTVPNPPEVISGLISALTPEMLVERHPTFGYVPTGSGGSDIVQALALLVNACSPKISKTDLLSYAQDAFGVSESSFGAALTTLTKSGLIAQTGLNVYSSTAAGTAWLEDPNALDLALLLHTRFLFFLEIIPLLSEVDRAPQLAQIAAEHYGLQRVDGGGIGRRLQVLKAAGLIRERATWRYESTALGERVLQEVSLQPPSGVDRSTETDDERPKVANPLPPSLVEELQEAAVASDAPVRLEKAVADAFTFLGFEARHIGGGGKTDVLATVEGPEMKPVRIVLDAKSARAGVVDEGAVSFDTLAEHKKQHGANFVALVGPSFEGGRVRKRAEQNHVALVTVDELVDVIRRHETTPRSAATFLKLVDPRPEARRDFDSSWSEAKGRIDLLAQVVAVLAKEAHEADEVTYGALSSDQIYLIVRDQPGPRPSPEDIENIIRLLEHPLIASVSRVPNSGGRAGGYHLADTPELVSAKLQALAVSIARVEDVG